MHPFPYEYLVREATDKMDESELPWTCAASPGEQNTSYTTSYKVFLKFVERHVSAEGNTVTDAHGLVGPPCFKHWVATRKQVLTDPFEDYRKSIVGHVEAVKGRQPFPADVEASLLKLIRRKEIWPAFEGMRYKSGKEVTIGSKGFQGFGHHEKKWMKKCRMANGEEELKSTGGSDELSLAVFTSYIISEGEIPDVSKVFQRECYESWLKSRKCPPKFPEDSFRKTLVSHVRGSCGRKPFPPQVEAQLVKLLRMKRIWPCFEGYHNSKGDPLVIGKLGFRKTGYHEGVENTRVNCNLLEPPTTNKRKTDELYGDEKQQITSVEWLDVCHTLTTSSCESSHSPNTSNSPLNFLI